MRKALNENPVVQVVLIGILVIGVGFLFMTRIAGGGGEEAAPVIDPAAVAPPATGAAAPTAAAADPVAVTLLDPSLAAPVAPTAGAAADEQGFVAGPGLPKDVVDAYKAGDTVVLLIVRANGIDDRKVAESVALASNRGDATLFVTRAKGIAKYSRIAQGVEVERVPAMIVIRPKRFADGGLPEASVSYGYRGPDSIEQAVRDANYGGRDDLPYYPE